MCGIAGILNTDGRPSLDAVQRMAKRLSHRGPDSSGQWESPSGHAALAHARLAIFDPSPAAAQPMLLDGRYAMTYNGAVYNYAALRATLQAEGDRFHTTSDTEVVLRAYRRYGAACVERLQGMFAFVIWDEQERRAFLARDVLGIKPLYYSADADRLLFASELRALAASQLVARELDTDALYGYFRSGSVPEPRTLLRSVRMLPAGATATWQDGNLTIDPPRPWPAPTEESAGNHDIERTRQALIESVDRHCSGDTPVGVLLSGGLDSCAILALAKAAGRDRVHSFSLAFPGRPDDEGPDAARAAAHFGATHHVLNVDAREARSAMEAYAHAIDQPSIDGLNTFMAARFAREHGVKVVLSGVGADELFGGYGSFWRVPAMQRWHRLAAMTGPLAPWTGAVIERAASNTKARRVGDLLQQAPSIATAYETFRGIYTRSESQQLVRHFTGHDNINLDVAAQPVPSRDPLHDISMLELTRYVRNQLLRDGDVMSMASGVELRTPFLDRTLTSMLWSLPSAVRIQPGKRLLAAAVPEVPSWTMVTPKRCFQLPFADWLQHDWRGVFDAVDAESPVPTETWYRQWSVYSAQRSLSNLTEAING